MSPISYMHSDKRSILFVANRRTGRPPRRRGRSGSRGPAVLRLVTILTLLAALTIQPTTTHAANSRPIIDELVVNVETIEGTPVVFQLPGYDPDGDPLTAYALFRVHGLGNFYQVNPDGTRGDLIGWDIVSAPQITNPHVMLWYEPEPGTCDGLNRTYYTELSYWLVDPLGLASDELPTVFVSVTCVPDRPVAVAAEHMGDTDSPITSIVLNYSDPDLANPLGALTVHFTRLPSHGTLRIGGTEQAITSTSQSVQTNFLQYAPNRCCAPLGDSFAWYVEDETGLRSAEVIETIHVGQGNWLPSVGATPTEVNTAPDTSVAIPFHALDSDGDATKSLVKFTTLPAHGTLVRVTPANPEPRPIVQGELWQPIWQTEEREELRFIPDTGYSTDLSGPDSFAYCLYDDRGGETCAAVRLWVSSSTWTPSISDVSPILLVADSSAPTTITVSGDGFTPTSQVVLNDTPLETIYGSATQLTATVPGNLQTGLGAAEITVLNSPGGASGPSFVYFLPATISVAATMTGAGTDDQSPFNVWADASAGRTAVRAVGQGTLGIARLSADPTGVGSGLTGFFSVGVGSNSFSMLAIIDCTTAGNTLYVFTDSNWAPAPNQSLAGGCLSADLTNSALLGGAGFSRAIIAVGSRDHTPPTTSASATTMDGNPYAFGGATKQAVMVSLSASDDAAGSGVRATYYALDGGAPRTYTGPFTVGAVGTHTLSFWSEDQAGNVEPTAAQVGDPANEVEINIHQLSPTVIAASATTADGQPYSAGSWTNQTVTVSFTCTDGSGMGLLVQPSTLRISMPTTGANQSITHTCQDQDGNHARTTFGPINIAIGQIIAPVPTIISVTPNTSQAGSGLSTIQLYGTGFAADASVWWNDIQLIHESGTATELTAYIEPERMSLRPTIAAITVVNPPPGGGTSNPVYFYVSQANVNVTGSAVGSSTGAEDIAEATVGGVSVSANGSGTVAMAVFDADPSAVAAFNGAGNYFDVFVAPGSSFTALTIVDCSLNGGNLVYWYDGITWAAASNQTYHSATGCVTITIDATTSPSLSQLTGTYFAAGLDSSAAPAVGPISAPLNPVQASSVVNVSASFTNADTADTHTAVWGWGDGTTSTGTVVESGGAGSVGGSHTYTVAGVYVVTLTVTDDDGDIRESIYRYVVVYDPSAGFVTGGGWINSPAGAYIADPTLTGKASFGFVAKYQKGATTPTGNTEFQFKAGDLQFHSSTYQWLVVAGARAQFKGTGTINGAGSYGFLLTSIDGQVKGGGGSDTFRIKIWVLNEDGSDGSIAYDNQLGAADDVDPSTVLGGGSIYIKKQ